VCRVDEQRHVNRSLVGKEAHTLMTPPAEDPPLRSGGGVAEGNGGGVVERDADVRPQPSEAARSSEPFLGCL